MKSLLSLIPLFALSAQAHSPVSGEDSLTIDDPSHSWAVDGTIGGDEVFVIELPMPRDFAMPFEILVPNRREYQDFRPAYAVLSAGLPQPTDAERAALPFEVPEGMGAYVDLNQVPERYVLFESFGRNVLISSGTVALPVRAGEVEVRVWSPDGTEGPFTLAFGVEEDFGGEE